ncbi:cytochrome P450 [Camillea tinctor]|nr:cytochrome P450 [Camillea tinctor]
MGLIIADINSLPDRHMVAWIALIPILWIIGYPLVWMIYNVFFHPLRKYPGPKLWAMTSIPYVRMSISGEAHRKVLRLHQTYGPVVRVGPNHLAFSHPDAMKELRGHRKNGTGENGKDPIQQFANQDSIIGANRSNHARIRKALAHGFSAQAMMAQQPIIKKYVDDMIEKLHRESAGGTSPVNIVSWLNWTTFDVIGDLAFGESFGCLENSTYHPWVSIIFSSIKNLAYMASIKRLPAIEFLLKRLIPRNIATKHAEQRMLSREKVRKRLATPSERPDFMDAMTRKKGSPGEELSFEELVSNASVLTIAGSETTATVLSATTYLLAKNPKVLHKLTEELKTAFTSENEIDLVSVQKLPYMLAVLDETLRIYPPVPSGSPRMIGEGGDWIVNQYVPAGTVVDIWQWPLYHNPAYFTQPDDFVPERWLGDPHFANDKLEAVQPFSVGPRNCIGKNLAYSEMRLILARLVWNFDIQLDSSSDGWAEKSQVYILWEKDSLMVYLKPRALK